MDRYVVLRYDIRLSMHEGGIRVVTQFNDREEAIKYMETINSDRERREGFRYSLAHFVDC